MLSREHSKPVEQSIAIRSQMDCSAYFGFEIGLFEDLVHRRLISRYTPPFVRFQLLVVRAPHCGDLDDAS